AEKKFWRCVQSGEVPHLIMAEPPRPRIDAVRIVDMSASNSWAEFAALFRNTRSAFLDHERAKTELKALMPGCQRSARARGAREGVESGGGECRRPDGGGGPCTGAVNRWRRSPRPWPRHKPSSSIRRSR